ncbi:alpha-1-3 1-6-mannosyltransferase ALG2 [Brachionus plicatilis]|uniref:Alpha-1,3/1,6-mannosyltransferase ALG2 n=1 Tax=Brachionus plicatilis TaxID=10195 RepID=A0A3M7RUG1_BRAPC|nr:alpha-1-3 1-6-mannosyltransferase ALG2 [Brachionus plicatilis]
MKLLFVHPDLGVGGAERLIVDTALAAQSNGHKVTILTNHYDPNHCFEDTKNLDILVKLSSWPRHVFGRFHAFLAYLKMFLASMWLIFFSGLDVDVVICDQISLPVCAFKWAKYKVLFYCHFPDQLLCVYDKRDYLKRFYRAPLNWLEMVTTGMADVILVNSEFTKKIFFQTFSQLENKNIDVLYPSLNTEKFDALLSQLSQEPLEDKYKENPENEFLNKNLSELKKVGEKKFVFLSINRYERKKDLKLAIKALKELRSKLNQENWENCHLIMAGGYDPRVGENINHYQELVDLAKSFDLLDHISFLRSISDKQKIQLLRRTICLIYTPTNEHFGIVPIEAMYCEKPVIATNTGGPLETVKNGVTGFLVNPCANEFANAMEEIIVEPAKQLKMSEEARKRVIICFSFVAFQHNFEKILTYLSRNDIKKDD